jgi:hypothetical protein
MTPVLLALALAAPAAADDPFQKHGKLRVARTGTHIEHADGTPFFVLADTCWNGPALSSPEEWDFYLKDRKRKGFTAIQVSMVAPWSLVPADAEGNVSGKVVDGKWQPNEAFYKRLDARLKAINDHGLLAMPVLLWALQKNKDLGRLLTAEQATDLVTFELKRYKDLTALWILAGDNPYDAAESEKWKKVGRAAFAAVPQPLVTTHPTGQNFPWLKGWDDEKWLTVLGYQSGHGDDDKNWAWTHSGPPAEYGRRKEFTRPVMNLEPPYEGHNGYKTRKPHSDYNSRRAAWWGLTVHPVCGVTYGGHGVWGWATKAGEEPTGHKGTGPAKVWRDALDLPGATQYGHIRKLFETLPWPELRPASDLWAPVIGLESPQLTVTSTATPDRKAVVTYMPAGGRAFFKPPFEVNIKEVSWFDPRTGEEKPSATGFRPPTEDQDWVNVIRRK